MTKAAREKAEMRRRREERQEARRLESLAKHALDPATRRHFGR